MVDITRPDMCNIPIPEFKLHGVNRIMICGTTGSGKTELIRQLVDNAADYYDSDGEELSILYCYKSECVEFSTEVMTCQSLPPVVELDAFVEQPGMKWLILDDLIDEFQGKFSMIMSCPGPISNVY